MNLSSVIGITTAVVMALALGCGGGKSKGESSKKPGAAPAAIAKGPKPPPTVKRKGTLGVRANAAADRAGTEGSTDPEGTYDANGALTEEFMVNEPEYVINTLVDALQPEPKARVNGIPIYVIDDPDTNAFAGCGNGGALMGITFPLIIFQAASSEAKAYDEQFGTNFYREYVDETAAGIKQGKPATGLAPGKLPKPGAVDPRKLARQRLLFDEQMAFVLGHELAHHYRGHTGCAPGKDELQSAVEDMARILSNTADPFNQPLEAEADQFGIRNVMDAGAKRVQGAQWNEEGAMLTMDFFISLMGAGIEDVLLGFLSTHPHPQIRMPIVRQTAEIWRQTGGAPAPATIPIPIPIPIPGLGQ